MRILIAEDEALIALDLRLQLEADGFEVCTPARDGLEAVELARSEEPDLAILDVRMPRLDGIEAARRITAERPIPIVILSAYSDRALVERAVDAGVHAYLVKPFDPRHLVPTLETALARHRELLAPPGAGPKARRRATSRGRRYQIVAAAATVFSERGYENATIQEIADVVGMLKGSLYYHISSKEDLLFEVIRDVTERQAATLTAGDGREEPGERLVELLRAYAAFAVENLDAVTVAVRDLRCLSPERRGEIEELAAQHVSALEALVAQGQRAGALTPHVAPETAAQVILGLGDALAARHRASEGAGASRFASAFVDVVAAGLFAGVALDAVA